MSTQFPTLRRLTLAILLGAAAAHPGAVLADDTEIYLGSDALTPDILPNVLFIVDTSISMTNEDVVNNVRLPSRLSQVKDAFNLVLDSVNNVNAGLMRFTDAGGPVLYPVANIESASADIDAAGEPDVTVRLSDGSDDAEELVSSGVVTLDSPVLEMSDTPISGGETTLGPIPVVSSSDDAEEGPTGFVPPFSGAPQVLLNSPAMVAVDDGGTLGNRIDGLRFVDIGIPTGARITSAWIDFFSLGDRSVEPLSLFFLGQRRSNPPTFTTSNGPLGQLFSNPFTGNFIQWSPSLLTFGSFHRTPDLSPIVQEIVSFAPGWNATADMTFYLLGFDNFVPDRWRDFATFDTNGNPSQSARLNVSYGTGPGGKQLVGLRFRDVRVPQNATILKAVIEFRPIAQSSSSKEVNIYGEVAADSAPFTATTNNLSNRLSGDTRSNSQKWTIPAWNDIGESQISVDLKDVVRRIVRQDGWCGGNNMSFIIEHESGSAAAARKAYSFESDSNLTPVLRIDYDQNSAWGDDTKGCTVVEVQRQISDGIDDAQEIIATRFVNTGGIRFNLSSIGLEGFRFRDIQIPQGAVVTDAKLFLTSNNNSSNSASLDIAAEISPNPGPFVGGPGSGDLSRRSAPNPRTWANIPETSRDVEFEASRDTGLDLPAVLQGVFDQGTWVPGNALVLIASNGSGSRRVSTVDLTPTAGARLYIKARIFLGRGGTAAVTVRQRLKELVNDLGAVNETPIVDTLYEAARYYRGEGVDYGRNRGPGAPTDRRDNRISHPGSYENGRVVPDVSVCTLEDPNSTACAPQQIVDDGGVPTYKSPIEKSCQANFIVLLTDGIANGNTSQTIPLATRLAAQAASKSKILAMTGDGDCSTNLIDGTPISKDTDAAKRATDTIGAQCGLELVEFLNTQDQIPENVLEGINRVSTYTIGFGGQDVNPQWLKDLATKGGGEFFSAVSSNQLVSVLRNIIDSILSRTTSFATPSVSVNAFNRLFHRNEVYFSLFEPNDQVRWLGNVKKYQLCRGEKDDTCTAGEVLDFQEPAPGDDRGRRAGNPAINDEQRISNDARSDWLPPGPPDGATVLAGGSGIVMQAQSPALRRILTYTGTSADLPDTLALNADINKLNDTITVELLGGSPDQLLDDGLPNPLYMPPTERDSLIDWIRGVDVDDEDDDENFTETRYVLTDPLHSSPVAVTFGCKTQPCSTDSPKPVIKVFVGTNDGTIRMLNAYTGEEEWAFIPPLLLAQQRALRSNLRAKHIYGMDGTPTLWVNDENNDGVIDPNLDENGDGTKEFVRMFIGMRRGGAQIIALDFTPDTVLSDPETSTIDPELLWILDGNLDGENAGPLEFARLGETWSRPRIATVRFGEKVGDSFVDRPRSVLMFAGGYDRGSQDGTGGVSAGAVGNAIYIVDPIDGRRLGVITSDEVTFPAHTADATLSGRVQQRLEIPGMDYPIPSDLALLDSDGDGSVDRIYVGDLGGRIWRVDVDADTSDGGLKLTGGLLAEVSTPGSKKNARKFFYPPDVVQVRDRASYSSNGNYDLVTIASGNRAHPLDLDVQDRFYAIYDETIGRMNDGNDTESADGIGDDFPLPATSGSVGVPIQGPVDDDGDDADFDAGDLLRVNDKLNFDPTTAQGAINLAELKASNGYYLDFGAPALPDSTPAADAGEKGLAPPVIIAGKVFFTTYLPSDVVPSEGCALTEGRGQLYGLNVLNGAPAYNYDESSDPDNLTKGDRVYKLGGGIPSGAVPIFQPDAVTLLIGGGGGATTVNPNVQLPRNRTYWIQE